MRALVPTRSICESMFTTLKITHTHTLRHVLPSIEARCPTTARVVTINQHEPLPPSHCIPEELHPLPFAIAPSIQKVC